MAWKAKNVLIFVKAMALVVGVLSVGACSSTALAQSVEATVDRNRISENEAVTLTIVLEGKFDDTSGPEIPDFDVVGRSSGSSISIVNGTVTRSQQIVLRLAPRRPGKLTIGSITMISKGKQVAKSKPITVVVGQDGPVDEPPPGQDDDDALTDSYQVPGPAPAPAPAAPGGTIPSRLAGQQAFIVATAPDRELYVGEPFYVEYKLYVRSDLPLMGLRLEAMPRFQQFVSQQAPSDAEQVSRVRIKNRQYDVRTIWRGTLSALQEGPAAVDSLNITLVLGDFFGRRQQALASEPVELNFKQPPLEGRPADYIEGTIGNFVIKASLDRASMSTSESALLTVELTGSGNLRGISAPMIPVPEGMKATLIPSSDLDKIVVDVGGASGSRAFQYLLNSRNEGVMKIGRIELSFFNAISQRYERARTEPLEIVVTGHEAGPVRQAGAPSKKETITVITTQVPDFSDKPESSTSGGLNAKWLYAAMSVPIAFFLGAEAATRIRRRRGTVGAEQRRAMGQARRALKSLKAAPTADFWNDLESIILNFLKARFQVLSAGTPRAVVRGELLAKNAPEDAVAAILDELEACAFAKFAPSAALDKDRHGAVVRVLSSLESLDKGSKGEGA